jgi:hypothetical protein
MIAIVQAQGNKSEVLAGNMQSLFVYKNLPEGDANKMFDLSIDTFSSTGKYSYNKATMGNARLDSYLLVYPAEGEFADSNRLFAEELQTYINRQAGYYMADKKDVAVVRADYMVAVGDTSFTDDALVDSIGDNDYYIALTAKETTLADGTTAPGAVLTILYGIDAEEAALKAFTEQIMPASSSQIDFNMTAGFVLTNNPALAK